MNTPQNDKCLIVIVSLNQLNYTRGCIESIVNNTAYPYKILVVDNGSDRETEAYLRGLRDNGVIDVIFNRENRGWVAAVNQGLFYSADAYVCVMNNDTLVYPGWLKEMVAAAESAKEAGLVNPLWELPRGFRGDYHLYFHRVVGNQAGQFVETDWARGFCFLVKRAVIQRIGGLDKAFAPAYYDDWDYSRRAINAGFICLRAKGALVRHYVNVTYPEVLGQGKFNDLFLQKRELFHRRWGRPLRIVFIFSRAVADKDKIKERLFALARAQHHLYLWGPPGMPRIEHTNVQVRVSPWFLVALFALLDIGNNLGRNRHKHYDIVFLDDYGLLYRLLRLWGLRVSNLASVSNLVSELPNYL
ncbi:MAG: glycosyltransferase family 2 protein [Candidatus Omnitrophota bacterium]